MRQEQHYLRMLTQEQIRQLYHYLQKVRERQQQKLFVRS